MRPAGGSWPAWTSTPQPSRRWLADLLAGFTDDTVVLVAGGLASYPPSTAAQRFTARHGRNDPEASRLDANSLFANGRNLAVRRDAALAIGGWCEDMLRGEDIDFSIRILEAFGGQVVVREHAVVFHHERETDEELRLQALGYGYGMALLYDRHPTRYPWGWRAALGDDPADGRLPWTRGGRSDCATSSVGPTRTSWSSGSTSVAGTPGT